MEHTKEQFERLVNAAKYVLENALERDEVYVDSDIVDDDDEYPRDAGDNPWCNDWGGLKEALEPFYAEGESRVIGMEQTNDGAL